MTQPTAIADSALTLKTAYEENGYVFPIRILPEREAADLRARIDAYLETSQCDPKEDDFLQFKPHFVFPWADRIVRHPLVLDAVEALLGPDLLVWNAALLVKPPSTGDFVSWHQDVYYWGNRPEHVVGAWLAISDSTTDNGCVQVIPRSHTQGILPHADTFAGDNMLSRGQRIGQAVDETDAVDMVLKAGEMSLHHTRTVHGSRPNRSDRWRIGLVITYMCPAAVMTGPRTGATLVRGRDTHGHFDLEEVRPNRDLDSGSLGAHQLAMRSFSAAIHVGAESGGRQRSH